MKDQPRAWINPSKTDFLYSTATRFIRPQPVYIGLAYFTISFVGVYVIGLITGQFAGKNGLAPMYTRLVDNFNLAFLAPVGAGLLCNLYNEITYGFSYLLNEGLIPDHQVKSYKAFLTKLERRYNSLWAVAIFLCASFGINATNYLLKKDSWLGINGGITGLYGRTFIFFNFFIIGLTFYKFVITTYAVRQLFSEFTPKIEPMHPDRAGGLEPIGRIALAVTALVGLVMAFFAVLLVFDKYSIGFWVYRLIFILFYLSSPYFFFATLSAANREMQKVKEAALQRLRLTFDVYYRDLSAGNDDEPYTLEAAENIAKVESLYGIVNAMPVWPFDTTSIVRFFSVFIAPAALFTLDFVISNFDFVRAFFQR